jgi:nicotinamide riboside kinase
VTIFGAESTGKSRLTGNLRFHHLTEKNRDLWDENELKLFPECHTLPEYARSYLENTENVITEKSMTAIWKGQAALQRMPFLDHPVIIQDTDLFSTVGYWEHMRYPISRQGLNPPEALYDDARALKSDLYLLTPSNVDFEPDPLRYGGDHREIPDLHWANLCCKHELNWQWLKCEPHERIDTAAQLIKDAMFEKFKKIAYERPHQ